MTNAIRSTIITAVADHEGVSKDGLEYQYSGPIHAAEQALLEREYGIVDRVVELALDAVGDRVTRGDVEDLLTQAGLTVRPQPEPEPEPEVAAVPAAERTDGERITALEDGQAKIVEALDRLTRLAEQHLGSSSL